MKKFSNILVVAISLSMIGTSCKTVCPTSSIATHDTVTVETTVTKFDTVFTTTPFVITDTVYLDDLAFKLHLNAKPKTKGNATISHKFVKGKIITTCFCDTIAIKAQLKTTLINKNKSSIKEQIRVKEVKYIPKWINFFALVGIVLSVLIIIIIIINIYKKINIL